MYWKQTELLDPVISDQIHEGRGLIRQRNLFRESSRLPFRIGVWELDKGVSEGDHIHEGPSSLEEIYYFLCGEGVMTIDGEEITVSAGDAIMVPPGVDHGITSTGAIPLKLIIIWGKPEDGHAPYPT